MKKLINRKQLRRIVSQVISEQSRYRRRYNRKSQQYREPGRNNRFSVNLPEPGSVRQKPKANPDVPFPELKRRQIPIPFGKQDTVDIDQETGVGEIPAEEEDAGEMARYHALNNDRDETLYRDNPDYKSAYDEINEGSDNKKVEVENQWYYGINSDFDDRWQNIGADYHKRGLIQYTNFEEDEDSDSDSE